MLNHTKAAYEKISEDFKRFMFYFNLLSPIVYISYLAVNLVTKPDFFYLNLALLIITSAYLIFFVCATWSHAKKELKRRVKNFYVHSKRILKLFILAILVYGIILERNNPSTFTILLTAISCITWALGLLLEIAMKIASSWWTLFFEGVKLDFELVYSIVRKFNDTPTDPPTEKEIKIQNYLKERVGEQKAKALAEKMAQREAKKQEAAAKREEAKKAREEQKRAREEEKRAKVEQRKQGKTTSKQS
jgi:hypothetical protein